MGSNDSFEEIMNEPYKKVVDDSFEELMNNPSDEHPNHVGMKASQKGSVTRRVRFGRMSKNKYEDDSTETTEFSEDLSYEPDKSRRVSHVQRGDIPRSSKNEWVYGADEFSIYDNQRKSTTLNDSLAYDDDSLNATQCDTLDDSSVDDNPRCNCGQDDVVESIATTFSALDHVLGVFSITEHVDEFSEAIHRAENELQ
jgi:hypothetical protein